MGNILTGGLTNLGQATSLTVSNQIPNNGQAALYQDTFSGKQFFQIPGIVYINYSVPAPASTSTQSYVVPNTVTLTLSNANSSDTLCVYTQSSSYTYAFTSCSQGTNALSVNANDTLSADSISLKFTTITSKLFTSVTGISFQLVNLIPVCSGAFSNNAHLLGSAVCGSATGALINMTNPANNSIVFDGHGNSISAPAASIGIYAQGYGITLRNIIISGMTNGIGALAYNTNSLNVQNSQFASNAIGMQIYSDTYNSWGAVVSNNKLNSNAYFGLRICGSAFSNSPTISNNDFSKSGGYALSIYGDGITISDTQSNNYSGSSNGLYLSGGNINVQNFSLATAAILNCPIYATNAYLTINNTNLTPSSTPSLNQTRVGLSLYQIKTANISQLTVSGADVAVKIATDSGVQSGVAINSSTLTQSVVAGIMAQSFDNTLFGYINIQNSNLKLNPPNFAIWSDSSNPAVTSYINVNSNNTI